MSLNRECDSCGRRIVAGEKFYRVRMAHNGGRRESWEWCPEDVQEQVKLSLDSGLLTNCELASVEIYLVIEGSDEA